MESDADNNTLAELRQRVCNHLTDNFDIYKGFLTNEDTYMQNVNYLREEGHWSNDMTDAMPLAVSNLLGRILKIYCSNRAHPVYERTPTIPCDASEQLEVINLAYLQIPGFEHYDGCSKASTIRKEGKDHQHQENRHNMLVQINVKVNVNVKLSRLSGRKMYGK